MKHLITYLVTAMLAWAPLSSHGARDAHGKWTPDSEDVTLARYEAIASDIATVATDPTEPSLYAGEQTGARTAVALATMAFFESKFWTVVDDGSCNAPSWRAVHAKKGSPRESFCDGSLAFSIWQIHPSFGIGHKPGGILLLDDGGYRLDATGIKGAELIADRKLAARVALHMLRRSMRDHGSWCGYTGESSLSGCPKAKIRRNFADRWWREHPFVEEPSP